MGKIKISFAEYIKKIAQNERERKPFIVGLIVFVIIFAGLNIYQNSLKDRPDDVIITDAESGVTPPETYTKQGSSAISAIPDEPEIPVSIFVDVGGAVNISGLFVLPEGSRVADAIEAAGGLCPDADVKYLNRATVLNDGDRLYVPTATEITEGTAPPSAGLITADSGAVGRQDTDAGTGAKLLVNLNTASSEELQKLDGVGPAVAQKIIDYRENTGRFEKIEDLMYVSGIGAKTFANLKSYISV